MKKKQKKRDGEFSINHHVTPGPGCLGLLRRYPQAFLVWHLVILLSMYEARKACVTFIVCWFYPEPESNTQLCTGCSEMRADKRQITQSTCIVPQGKEWMIVHETRRQFWRLRRSEIIQDLQLGCDKPVTGNFWWSALWSVPKRHLGRANCCLPACSRRHCLIGQTLVKYFYS